MPIRSLKQNVLVFSCLFFFLGQSLPLPGQNHERKSFTRDELLAEALNWLAKPGSRDLIHIYKLSCPSCIVELKAALRHDPGNLGPIYLSTYKKADRPLAQALIATTLSHPDEKRAEIFGELLTLFANSAESFLKNAMEWRKLCLNFWNVDGVAIDNPAIWTDALNWMDRQNRMAVLMDATTFPGSLVLRDVNPIPPVKDQTYRDQFVFAALSLPWLKYPDIHPVKNMQESQNHPEGLPVTIVNPLRQYPAREWRELAATARSGTFWHFVGDPDITLHPRLLEFLAAFLDMPTDEERREAFAKAIEALAGDGNDPPKSILASLPRTKGIPKVSPERKKQRVEEARKMMDDFLSYDALRQLSAISPNP